MENVPEGFRRVQGVGGFNIMVGPLYEKRIPGGGAGFVRAFRVREDHLNGRGVCHGGMLSAFADVTMGNAVTVALRRYWATVRLVTDFIAPGHLGNWIEGSAQVAGCAGDFVSVRGNIWCGERTLMHGTAVLKVLGARPEDPEVLLP